MNSLSIAEGPGSIPAVFQSRKRQILAELFTPDAEYTDSSPKGSVDEGIRDLINDINDIPGLVTTSSCAGRISVFLEGRQQQQQQQSQRYFAPSGGKGAGRWLFVSHEPLTDVFDVTCVQTKEQGQVYREQQRTSKSLHDLFGIVPSDGKPPGLLSTDGEAPRLVRFHFEPMILHIMAASLPHAQPVLAAASSSGFRESGLQSLRCLESDDGPSPIVAVRSSGLALESIVGYCDDQPNEDEDQEPVIRSLVSEEYLKILVAISNERFFVNAERKQRFRNALIDLCSRTLFQDTQTKGGNKIKHGSEWEDPDKRRQRKRAEGLMHKKLVQEGQANTKGHMQEEIQDISDIF